MGIEKEKICPLCGQNNHCRHGEEDCWCTHVDFPRHVLDRVPEDKRNKVCICPSCLEKYR